MRLEMRQSFIENSKRGQTSTAMDYLGGIKQSGDQIMHVFALPQTLPPSLPSVPSLPLLLLTVIRSSGVSSSPLAGSLCSASIYLRMTRCIVGRDGGAAWGRREGERSAGCFEKGRKKQLPLAPLSLPLFPSTFSYTTPDGRESTGSSHTSPETAFVGGGEGGVSILCDEE